MTTELEALQVIAWLLAGGFSFIIVDSVVRWLKF